MAAVRSLYRRALRLSACCVEEHQAWMTDYVRQRFRDDAFVRGGGAAALKRRLAEAEDELDRMVHTLQRAGRLDANARVARQQPESVSTTSSPPKAEDDARPSGLPPYQWDENAVGEWLQGIGLGQHAPAFARCRVDGRLLLKLDDEDLSEELGVTSRLERKRMLSRLEALRAEMPLVDLD